MPADGVFKKLFFIPSFVFAILLLSRAGNAGVGSWLYDITIGDALKDENTVRSLTQGVANGAVDAVYQGTTGCPSDAIKDTYAGVSSSDTCSIELTGQEGLGNGSLLAISTNSFQSAIDTPMPTNLALYFNDLKTSSIIFREAQAGPVDQPFIRILNIWKAMRNIAYGLLAGTILVVALMISMRSKIDPQTVVTAQSAIPKIIISAVLITFSYAIGAVFVQTTGWFGPLSKTAIWVLVGGLGSTGEDIIPAVNCPAINGVPVRTRIITFTDAVVCTFWKLGGPLFSTINSLGLVIITLVGIIMIIILAFVATYVYLTRYVKILLLTIFAPLLFVIAVIPGQEHRIKDWFLDMLGAVLAIPAMIFMILLGIDLFLNVAWDQTSPGAGLFSNSISIFVGGLLMFAVWIYALKVPGVIDNSLRPKKSKSS